MEEGWNLDWEKLGEMIEVEFLGIAIDVRYPCNCIKCSKGKEKLEEMGSNRSNRQLHIVVAPLNRNWKLQHTFVDMSSTSKKSRKGVLAHACMIAGIPTKTFEEFKNFLTKHVMYWKKTTIKDYLTNVANVELTRYDIENLNLDAQVTIPTKVLPRDAWELEGLTEEIVKNRIKLYKKAWKKILEGEDEETVYGWLFEELEKTEAEELEEMLKEEEEIEEEEEEEEEETKKAKKSKKAKKEKKGKKAKKVEEEEEVEEEIEEEEETEEIEEEEEEEEELL